MHYPVLIMYSMCLPKTKKAHALWGCTLRKLWQTQDSAKGSGKQPQRAP